MPNRDKFSSVRKEYEAGSLSEQNLPESPIELFQAWYKEAQNVGTIEPNAFALTTCLLNMPSVRYVLLKDISQAGFSFFTNYESRKGQELELNPSCAGAFYWKELERQVRFEGIAQRLADKVNDEYFATRPREAQIGVHVSGQSQIIPNRKYLEEEFKIKETLLYNSDIPRPEYWGGYIIEPNIIEFWQGRVGRLHDRIRYSKEAKENWEIVRLSP